MNNNNQIAFISVDNTRTFEDKNLNELYVNQGEEAAIASKTIIDLCKNAGILTVNVLEEHPLGHISFASSFTNKNPRELLTYEEVANWTNDNNELAPEATFTVDELQEYMKKVGAQMLWPDHGVVDTEGTELQKPLDINDFDIKVVKGDKAYKDAYSGFDNTDLDERLQENQIKELLLGGVATDYCVGDTALGGIAKGYKVIIIEETVRGVTPETTSAKIKELKAKGVKFVALEKIAEKLNNLQ